MAEEWATYPARVPEQLGVVAYHADIFMKAVYECRDEVTIPREAYHRLCIRAFTLELWHEECELASDAYFPKAMTWADIGLGVSGG